MNGKRHAVIQDQAGRFWNANGLWVSEYPNATKYTPKRAIQALGDAASTSPNQDVRAIAHYGENNQEGLACSPARKAAP